MFVWILYLPSKIQKDGCQPQVRCSFSSYCPMRQTRQCSRKCSAWQNNMSRKLKRETQINTVWPIVLIEGCTDTNGREPEKLLAVASMTFPAVKMGSHLKKNLLDPSPYPPTSSIFPTIKNKYLTLICTF